MFRTKLKTVLLFAIFLYVCLSSSCLLFGRYYVLAKFDVGNGREINIIADREIDINQPILYQVKVNGKEEVPLTFLYGEDPDYVGSLRFKLLSSKDKQLFGIVRESEPDSVLVVHNFANGETCPRCDVGGCDATKVCQQKCESLTKELQKDNPIIKTN